ncbi:MAG TPA: MerR family transcriptional regulator [Streptosporangiaceae bacterium]|nr:MerR family transcriptional regulator [Streptosporangiaceae bacterium]
MSEPEGRGQFGIGEVLVQLRPEFPDISTSKIRFLEAKGLIEPARSQSGYRRFSAEDIERLRYILTVQRDSYLPLQVIRERLAGDTDHGSGARGATDADGGSRRTSADMSRRQLLEAAGIDDEELTDLEDYGLIRRVGRQYGPEALAVVRAVSALRQYGVQARHLRAVKAAADRDANLIEQVVAPQLRQRDPGARDAAIRTAWQIADLTLRLHATLVESALGEAGLAAAPGRTGRYEPEPGVTDQVADSSGPSAGGLRSASGRLRVYLGKGRGGQKGLARHVRTELQCGRWRSSASGSRCRRTAPSSCSRRRRGTGTCPSGSGRSRQRQSPSPSKAWFPSGR